VDVHHLLTQRYHTCHKLVMLQATILHQLLSLTNDIH
jgi:hypothetical protein